MYYAALIIIACIFIWRITAGFKKGMVQELVSLIAMAAAGCCIVLILGAVGSYLDKEIGKVIQMVVVLLVVCLVYRLVNLLFTSLGLIAKLPIMKGLDKLLGVVLGMIEAAVISGLLIYLVKDWGLSFLSL